MNYKLLKNTWIELKSCDICCKNTTTNKTIERYEPPVTLSLPEWQQYVTSGNNILLGSGGVIPGGTQGGNLLSGSVYRGHVRQGYGMY